jgi:hypothetical protein
VGFVSAVVNAEVTAFANCARVKFTACVLTASRLFAPTLGVIAVSAKAMGVKFGVHMFTLGNLSFSLLDRLGFFQFLSPLSRII